MFTLLHPPPVPPRWLHFTTVLNQYLSNTAEQAPLSEEKARTMFAAEWEDYAAEFQERLQLCCNKVKLSSCKRCMIHAKFMRNSCACLPYAHGRNIPVFGH